MGIEFEWLQMCTSCARDMFLSAFLCYNSLSNYYRRHFII